MMIELKNFCEFLDSKINTSYIEKNTYVSTENMFQNKAGICVATNLPDVLSVSSFQKNDILISNIRPYFKKIYYAKFDGGCSNDVLVFRAKENTDSKFLYYVLSDDKFFDYATATAKGTKMPRGDKVAIMKYSVPNFDIAVQKRIAGILGALDDRIDVLRRENVVLEQMAQAVFQSWFVDFDIVRAKAAGTPESEVCEKYHISPELYALFPSALTPDNLPLGWEKKKLGDFLILSYGKALKENDRVSGSVPVYGSSGQIGTHNESLVKAPGIVVGRKGTVGSVIWCDYDFYPIDTVFYVQFLKEGACWYFAYFLLKILKLQNLAGDSAVPGLNRDAAYAQTFVCPRTELLSSFEEVADVLFCKIKNNAEQIRTLSATRDALLPKLMNGEIEV